MIAAAVAAPCSRWSVEGVDLAPRPNDPDRVG